MQGSEMSKVSKVEILLMTGFSMSLACGSVISFAKC